MHPNEVVDDVLDAPERVDEQVDEAQDDIADVDDPVNLVYSPVAEQQEDLIDFAIEDQEMGFDAGNVSYDAATSSQHVSPVAPSAPPAEPSCPSQTDLDEQPLGQALPIKVSSPQCGTICVQGYNVKQSVAPILEAIFKKHGDIAAECLFKTAPVRSYFLEVVCEAVTRIEMDDVTEKMEEINCRVSDAEAANINVSWLRAHLEAVKRKKAIKKWDLLMETKVNTGLVKRAAQMDLRERCEELVAAQERFEKAERCARVLHLVEKNLKSAILESKDVNSLLSKDRII